MTAPADLYEQLAEVAEHELALARAHRFDELRELSGLRAQLVRRLPATPPFCARDALRRCLDTQQQVTEVLLRNREELLEAISGVQRGQRAARGYLPPGRRRSTIQTEA